MKSTAHRTLRALFAAAPVALLGLSIGCPKKNDPSAGAATSTSVSSDSKSPPSASATTTASAAYPKTVLVPETPSAEPDAMALDFEGDATIDADPDALVGDALIDAPSDAHLHADAPAIAPLMGAATYQEELPARGVRRITSAAARVHKAPKDGSSIANLTKGTEVWLVAEFMDWYRVKYVDPNTQIARQGWIYGVNFAGPRMKVCPNGWTLHDQDGGWCDRECKRNTDCKAIKGYKCSGDRCFYAAD